MGEIRPGGRVGALNGGKLVRCVPVLRLLPVGEEHAYSALRPLIAAVEQAPGMAARRQQRLQSRPLGGGKELGGAGDGAVLRPVQLVQGPGQDDSLLRVLGKFVEQLGLIHSIPLNRQFFNMVWARDRNCCQSR